MARPPLPTTRPPLPPTARPATPPLPLAPGGDGDTVEVERVDLEEPAPPTGTDPRYLHVPSPEDMTPLPPPRVQASIIAEASGPWQKLKGAVPTPVQPAISPTGDTRVDPAPTTRAIPLPERGRQATPPGLPPAPRLADVTGPHEQVAPTSVVHAPRNVIDGLDAKWTLALWLVGASLSGSALVWALMAIVDATRAGTSAAGGLVVTLIVLLLYPALVLGQAIIAAQIESRGVELRPDQLRDEWQLYVDVANRLGLRAPPRLFLLETTPEQRRLLGLVRRRLVVVGRADLGSRERLQSKVARELGLGLAGHGEPLDEALLASVRALSFVTRRLTGWLGGGLGLDRPLAQARTFTADRAAYLGVGQLAPVVEEILAGGDPSLAARIDEVTLERQEERLGSGARLLARASSDLPAPRERLARLRAFAGPRAK